MRNIGPVEKGLGIAFSLIILTILVYHGYNYRPPPPPDKTPSPPPPPKTAMDYLPVQENFAMFRKKNPDDDCHFVPDAPQCKAASYTDAYATHDGPTVEGMSNSGSLNLFVKILLQMLWIFIYILITLPEHILFFVEGVIWIWLAILDEFIMALFTLAIGLYDLGVMFVDITKCGLTWSQNLPTCLLWYLIDLVIYILVMIFVWLPILVIRVCTFGKFDPNPFYVKLFGVKGYPDVDQGYIQEDGILAHFSHICYRYTGYEFMHFPDFILQKCYSCDLVGDFMNFVSDIAFAGLRTMQYTFRDIGYAIPLFWHASYMDMLFSPPEVGKFPPIPPISGNLEKYRPPPVPPRLAGAKPSTDVHG